MTQPAELLKQGLDLPFRIAFVPVRLGMALSVDGPIVAENPHARLAAHRASVAAIRERGLHLFRGGSTGVQVAADICASTNEFLIQLLTDRLGDLQPARQEAIQRNSAMIGVGGTGRGELAPYSDADLLFLYRSAAGAFYPGFVAGVVRDCWDAGVKLGHSVRTIGESVSMAKQDAQVATAVTEARLLWGSQELFDRFQKAIARRVVRARRAAFVADCVAAREQERVEHGRTVSPLEPDVKRSLGGLRDVHLIRWIGFAFYGTTDIESLRLQGALGRDDARLLITAQEFLMRIRIDLHFHAGKPHDVLSRDAQLRIADERGITGTAGQIPVERFMQTYFQHSTTIADIVRRFVAAHHRKPFLSRVVESIFTRRVNGHLKIGAGTIDVIRKHRPQVLCDLDGILRVYHAALWYGVVPTIDLADAIRKSLPADADPLSAGSARLFREIMGKSRHLGPVLRSMYETGVLELVVPDMKHARCLLQFNQYHSYTVDEHTLRAVEAATACEDLQTPVGTAYRSIRQKEILHVALLLHDLGKGFEGSHSEVGAQIALRIAGRLQLGEHDCDTLTFLVREHLKMAHLGLRRDTSSPDVLLEFGREVGSPETLRLLYVLTAADFAAVGPGVWTEWKADLLTEFYDRVMQILSGKGYQFLEEERMERIKEHVQSAVIPLQADGDDGKSPNGIRRRLDTFPPHYLSATPPDRIAADLAIIGNLQPGQVIVNGKYESETGTVEYRVFAFEKDVKGCFHRTCGALSAKRLEILSAQISTTSDGVVVDGFRVLDNDFDGTVPGDRIEEVAESVRNSLLGAIGIPELFQRHRRYNATRTSGPLSNLPTRVVVDNRSSDRCTIVDVFAHDRPALLYTIARAIYQMELSVELAKIATHLDQVVDVFYVTGLDGRKVEDEGRLQYIRDELTATIVEFTRQEPGCVPV